MQISSPAFKPGERIPKKYTAKGENLSPPLEWSEVPGGTVEFLLVMEDPDAPQPEPWVHWIAHGIPGEARPLSENGAEKGTEATNSLGNRRYDGPMPPLGHGVHNYRFILYALDTNADLDETIGRKDVMDALEGHIFDTAELRVTYERPL